MMIVMTKREADKLLVDSLFSGKTLTTLRYDLGKYEWLGSQAAHIEKAKNETFGDDVRAVWFEKTTDTDGVFCAVWCLS